MRIFYVLAVLVSLTLPEVSLAGDNKTYQVGKPTQNVTPRFFKEQTRPDGSKSVVYGNSATENGKIVGDHGHSVKKDGQIVYSRTIGGKVLKDKK